MIANASKRMKPPKGGMPSIRRMIGQAMKPINKHDRQRQHVYKKIRQSAKHCQTYLRHQVSQQEGPLICTAGSP